MHSAESEAMVRDLERVRFVTENYEQLQGLRWAPIGLYFCLYFWFSLTIWSSDRPLTFWWGLVSLVFAVSLIAGMFWAQGAIPRYYQRRFGQVRRGRWIDTVTLPSILLMCLFCAALLVNRIFHPPVDLALLSFGVCMFVDSWPDRRFRIHPLIMMPVFIAASFLPLLGVWSTSSGQEPSSIEVFLLFMGLYFVVSGVLDHLLLVRTMKQLPEEDVERAV